MNIQNIVAKQNLIDYLSRRYTRRGYAYDRDNAALTNLSIGAFGRTPQQKLAYQLKRKATQLAYYNSGMTPNDQLRAFYDVVPDIQPMSISPQIGVETRFNKSGQITWINPENGKVSSDFRALKKYYGKRGDDRYYSNKFRLIKAWNGLTRALKSDMKFNDTYAGDYATGLRAARNRAIESRITNGLKRARDIAAFPGGPQAYYAEARAAGDRQIAGITNLVNKRLLRGNRLLEAYNGGAGFGITPNASMLDLPFGNFGNYPVAGPDLMNLDLPGINNILEELNASAIGSAASEEEVLNRSLQKELARDRGRSINRSQNNRRNGSRVSL